MGSRAVASMVPMCFSRFHVDDEGPFVTLLVRVQESLLGQRVHGLQDPVSFELIHICRHLL